MTKQEAKYIAVITLKMDESFTALEKARVGSQAEKDLRKTINDYQTILARIKPGTPNNPPPPSLKADGFKSLI